jgi:predicted DNA-binding protein (MmcQ/YjbR family)
VASHSERDEVNMTAARKTRTATPPTSTTSRAKRSDPLVEFCRALPGATEDVKWEKDLIFSVGGKMFAGFQMPEGQPLAFKVDPLAFDGLVGKNGIVPAPYMAKHSWISVTDRAKVPEKKLTSLLEDAHRIVAAGLSARAQAALGLAGAPKPKGAAAAKADPGVDALFVRAAPAVRATYEAVLEAARKVGPMTVEARKTSIHLVRQSAFAGIATRKEALVLTVKSGAAIKSPRVWRSEKVSANRWHVEIKLASPKDVDKDVRAWLTAAYAMSS